MATVSFKLIYLVITN